MGVGRQEVFSCHATKAVCRERRPSPVHSPPGQAGMCGMASHPTLHHSDLFPRTVAGEKEKERKVLVRGEEHVRRDRDIYIDI